MNKKEIFIICLLLCFICSLQVAVAADVDVNGTDDSVLTISDSDVVKQSNDLSSYSLPENNSNILRAGNDDGSFTDLKELIDGGDTVINLDKNYSYNSEIDGASFTNGIDITKPITINGNGFTISGEDTVRIFNIHSSVTLNNIRFVNGYSNAAGGAIYAAGNDGTMTNVTFENNRASTSGGAIFIQGNNWNVFDSTFKNNTALSGDGGAIYLNGEHGIIDSSHFEDNKVISVSEATGFGGAVSLSGPYATIKHSTFTGNNAGLNGGAVVVKNANNVIHSDHAYMLNNTFTYNTASRNGGAICWNAGCYNGTAVNCTFEHNIAKGSGGGIGWQSDNSTVINCTFRYNNATGEFGPANPGNGGGLVFTGSNGYLYNCTFEENNAKTHGGAVFVRSNQRTLVPSNNTWFIGCTFTSNTAGVNGGAAHWFEGATYGHIINSTFTDNTAKCSGGAVYWNGHDGQILHSNFTNNIAMNTTTDSNGNGGDGGAIMWSGIGGFVDDCWFIGNNATQRGGAVFLQNCTHGNCTNTTFSHVYFINNTAGVNGGAIDWHKGAQNGHVKYAVFENNTALRSGGAIFWFGTVGEILHSTFINNSALGKVMYENSFGVNTTGGHGGAVMWTGKDGHIDNCTFVENDAKVNGGAIFMQGSTEGSCSNITISNVEFTDNFAGVNGGAVDWYKGAHDCTLENATFTNNIANRSGGAVFWFGQHGTIRNASFTNNSALGNVMYENSFGVNTTGGHGGAIMWTGADGIIDDCTFDQNKAKVNGGAIFMQGSTMGNCSNLTISNVIFNDNFAGVNGGAVDWYKGAHDCTLENATFNDNIANRSGGAVFWYGEHGSIKNASFTNNQALGLVNASSSYGYNTTGGDGGAVMWTGSDGIIDGCNFTQNYAAARGGAIFLQGSVEGNCTNVTVSNSNFEQNKAEINGGAINFFRGAVDGRILNSTFKSNEAITGIGGAVVWRGYNGTIDGATFDDNNAYAADAGAVYIEGDSCELLNTEFNSNLAGDDGGAVYWTGNYGKIYNLTANDNKGISYGTSHSKGGTIIVTGSNMTIDTVEVRNGYAEVEGGGLFLTGNNVNITNVQFYDCTVNDNSADNIGGALDIIGNNTRLINATIEGSDARYGGAIDWAGNDGYACNITVNNNRASEDGAALRIVGDSFEIENSIFNDNEAGDDGGAIYWSGGDGIARNLTFNNNRGISSGDSSSNGGTMAIIGSNILIEDSSFKKSVADIAGGAIFVTGNNVNITGSSFEECSVSMDKVITGRDYTTGGGAIYVLGNETHIMNCTFDNTYGREGGVIYVHGNNAVIDNATTSNSHALNGGAFYIAGVNAVVSNSAISLSHVTAAGGAIYINGQHARVLNTTVDDTYAKKASDYDDTNLGGAIYINGNYANILGSEFENSGAYQGGALYLEGNYCNLTNSSIKDGYAYADGGALYSTGSYSNIYYSNFTSNEARGDGGAMYWFGGKNSVKNTIVGCIFLENVAYANSNSNTKGGGAIYWSEGGYYGTIKDSQFINNSVQSSTKADGGAILWDKCHFAVIDNCIFDGDYIETTNTGDVWVQGGAIYLRVDDPYTISNSKFVNCYSEKEAGALYIQSNTNGRKILIVNTTFENNVAQAIGQNSYGGGAVQVKQCDFAVFQNVTFRNNTANQGGAVTILETRTTIQFTNCTFDNNNATNGNGGSIWANRLFYIYNTTIANSTASDYGGGLYTTADITYNNLTFINNTATYGGGLYWNKANIKIQNMKFINNTAFERGGAIYITTTATVQNVTMTGNKAFTGSAIWANKDLTLIDVYVMENQANSSSLDISFDESSGKIVVLFKGKDKYLNAIYLDGRCILYCTNVTYWDETGEINSGETRIRIPTTTSQDTPEGGQNLTVRVYGGNGVLLEQYLLTDNNGKVYLDLADILPGEDYHEMYVEAELNDDTYYTIIKSTTRSPSQVNASANKTTYHSNSTIDVNVTQGATGNVSVYLGDVFLANITLNNSKGSINISTLVEGAYLPAGNHTLAMVYNGNVKYDKSNTTAILEITKITPVLLLNVTGIGYNLLVNVTVMDGEYNISDATGNVTIQVEDRTATIYLGNGQGMTIIYGLPIGNYTVNATYHGDNNYYSITNSTEANVTEKTQTVLVLDVDSEKLYYINETVPIKVIILPNGEGNVTLYINGIPHELTLQTVGDSTFVEFNATELKDGINYVFATYEGTEIFAPSWAQDTFRVTKYNSIIGIETANITFKDTESINITLPDDAEGIIKVLINDTPYLVELVGGVAQVNVSDLAVGTYNVTVIFNGDKKYYNSTNSTLFKVTKIKPVVTIDVDNVTYGNETIITVTLPDGVTGNVTVKINDTYYVFDTQNLTDSKAILPGVILPAGNYTVEATYNGDANYSVSANSTNFTVYKATPVINVTVDDIYYGEVANITVTVGPGVTGTIVIKVNGSESEPLTISEGKVNLTVSGLAVGNYPIEVIYSGNDNFTDRTITDDFNVFQIGTVLDVDVHDITIWDKEYINITIRNATGAVITNATGNVTININGVNHTAEIKDGIARFNTSDLTIGHKVVWVFYDGDRNLTGNRSMEEFDVSPRTPVINITAQNITVGQLGNITVKAPLNATGFVVIEVIGDDTYFRFISNGQATVYPKDLKVGNYTVKATYYGGGLDNYTVTAAEDVNFTVSKLNATVDIDVKDINYTETAVITVTVPDGVSGNITIKLNDTAGTTETKTIVDGKAIFEIDNLAAGNYTVNVTYNGNDDYNINNTEHDEFEVKKIDPTLQIYPPSATAGEKAVITIFINDRIDGEYVTITGLDKEYTKEIMNGVVSFTTDGSLDYDSYTMTVTYAGNQNFTDSTKSVTFTPAKISDYEITVNGTNITVNDDEIITVTVPTGVTNVSIWVNGTKYTNDSFVNGEAKFNITGLKEGVYTVNATVNDVNYTTKVANNIFTVSKTYPSIDITVINDTSIYVGDTVKVIVTVPSDVTENVTIEINGRNFTNATVNGNATFYIPDITYGDKTVVATYVGDDKYRFNSTTANFTVNKRTPTIVVTTDGPIDVGDNITISVDVPANATGYVVVNVNGTNYTINITNGDYSVVVPGLGYGTWNVTATYIGDDQYLPNINKTSFVVNKVDSTIAIDVESIDYGNKVNITVTVKDDATGYITIRINETRNITLPIDGGKVNWIVDNLAADNYTVYANYSGDDKYNENKTNKTFEVRQISPEIEIIRVISTADENATIIVKVDPRVTENVTVTVGGKPYSKAVDENGVAVITTDVLDYGTYTVTASYAGDKNFTIDSDTYEFTTNKTSDYSINITATDIKVGNNTNITVRVPADATGNVIIELNGTNYTAIINEDGIAVLNNISTLKEGVYNVTAYFGNDKYANKTVETRFAVTKVDYPITITVINETGIYVGDTVKVVVSVPEDATEDVTIEINGQKFTNATVDGNATFYVPAVTYGNKTVVATYPGDDKYVFNSTTAKFTVSKRQSQVNVTANGANVGENATITVNIPTNATGYVIVNVDGVNYTVNTTDGTGSIEIANLGNKTYTVKATYIGDDQYLPSENNTVTFTMNKIQPAIVIEGKDIEFGQDEVISIELDQNITDVITIDINGKNYTAVVVEGKGNLTVPGLAAGDYEAVAYYRGDDKFLNATSAVATFKVNATSDLDVVIEVQNITFGDKETITVYVNATGTVNITVDGVPYDNLPVQDGKVVLEVPGYLTAGNYTVYVDYNGNDNYTNVSAHKNFTVAKADPIITIEVQNITYGDAEHIIVHVKAEGNVTITTAGNSTTIVLGQEETWILRAIIDAIPEYDGKATLNIKNLPAGVYPVEATYNGNENYNSATVKAIFTVSQQNTTVSVEVEDIRVDGKEVINVTLSNKNATGNVTINVDGKNYTATLKDGKANITLDKLSNATHSVVVIYEGDHNFNGNWTSATFNVTKVKPTLTIDVTNKTVGETELITINLPENATGYVVVDVDGTKYHVDIVEGQPITLEVPKLENKTYAVTATYSGDGYYDTVDNSTSFNVSKVESQVTVKVENITVGDVEAVNITVTTGATGNVTIKIGDEYEKTVGVIDGVISVIVPGLTVGNKTVDVTYKGDDKYLPSKNSTTFTVSKVNTTETSIKVIDQGNRTVVVAVPDNATGNVTIKVGNETYTGPVVNGTAVITLTNTTPGPHEIEVIYSGDGNYTNATKLANVTIPRYETPISVTVSDIKVGDKAIVEVKLPENATGNVTIEINGKEYTTDNITDGVARFEVEDLAYGNKTVAVKYSGDDNYVGNFTTGNFTVSKRDSTVNVTVSPISVGEDLIVNVTIPANATGYVIVNVDGTEYSVNTTGGNGTVAIKGIGNGTHTINVTYIGDDQYLPSSNSTTVSASKVPSTVNVTAESITLGDVAVINITVPEDATGNITVSVNGTEVTVGIVNGTATAVIPGLKVGNYTVDVSYNGDDKYLPSENSTAFEVGKVTTEGIKVIDQGNRTVVVAVPDNATGNVTIKVGNETYTGPVVNGTAVITLTNTTPGTHDIEVIYSGDENHTAATTNATVTIPKYDAPIDVTVSDIKVGDKAIVEVKLPENATGNVTIEINGKEYTTDNITDGVARFEVEDLAYGNKTVAVKYSGDDNYLGNYTTGNFTVDKRESFVTVDVEPANVGEDVTVKVNVPENATGWVHVTIDNQTYVIKVTDGVGTAAIKGLASGNHTVDVEYLGDEQYFNSTNSTTVKVSKVPASINVTVDDITVGENAVINIEAPEDLCGNVTVTVDGKNYTVPVSGGKGTLVVPGLTVGNKTVDVAFDGCKKYEPASNSTTFEVSKVNTTESSIKVIDQGNRTVVVTVPDNATGNVTIKVGNETYTGPVVNGTAVITLTNTTPGTHDIEVIYSGDENHTAATTNSTVTIPKHPTPIKVTTENINVGDTATITVEVPEDATGNVTIEIDGNKYTAEIKDGKATFNIENLTAGNKTVAVNYVGDDNYTGNHTTGNFTVSKVAPEITVKATNSTVGDKVVIEVTAPSDVTRPVLVDVGGKGYYVNITDGKGTLEIDDLTSGNYTVTAKYLGDDKYTPANATGNFKVDKVPSTVSVEVDDITVGDKAVITVKVPKDATGNVTVTVDGKDYNVSVADGKGTLVIPSLKAGNYTVDAKYNGDDKYESSSNSTEFEVSKKDIDDMKVIDQGNGTVVVVVGDNATGNVTIKVGNNTYTVPVENGTAVVDLSNETPGTHDIEVIYSGDDTHEGQTTDATVTIPKLDTPISVDVEDSKVGDTSVITVNVPDDATGNVTIEVDGNKYTAEIKDGKAVFEVPGLTAGNKTVAVDYVGDDNYTGNHTTAKFTVSKVPSTVSATVEDSKVGENVTVKVTVPEDATGQVLVDINGVGYYVNVTNGTGSVEIPRVPSGKYDVNVTYLGDDKYLPSSNKTSFNVDKLPSYVIPTAKDIAVGDTEKITFELPEDATGTLTVIIDGEEFTVDLDTLGAIDADGNKFTVAVSDGKAVLTINDLPKGEYTVEVRYNGDDKYMPSTNSTKFTVSKTSIDMEITDNGDGTVKVDLPDDATGNVTIKVGNNTYTVPVVNGTAIVNLTNATPGTHDIEVIYSGDDKYGSQDKNSTVTIPKYDTPISVEVEDINVGDTAKITVNVPEDATGTVTIEINGKEYTAEIKDGKAVFEVPDLTAGDKTVAVKYAGDKNYVGNFTTGNFTVSKVPSTASATSKDIKVGKDEVITVTVPKDATGRVLVDINGVGYYADIVNGKAKVIVPELPSGKYTAKVTYEGDDKYLPSTTTTKFTVTKNAAPISASGDEIPQGKDATVVVKVPSDATGTVTITVDGKKYAAEVKDGKAVFVIPGLTKGDHGVTAVYSGDKKYDANDTITDIEVVYPDNPDNGGDHGEADVAHNGDGINLSQHATGNPILVLLLIIMVIGSTQIRRFRK